jgi:hypothetical protein
MMSHSEHVPFPPHLQNIEAGSLNAEGSEEEIQLMSGSSEEEDASFQQHSWWRPVIMTTSALALVALAAMAFVGQLRPDAPQYAPITGRQLFESPAIVDAMTEAFTADALRRGQLQESGVPSIRSEIASSLRAAPEQLTPETRNLLDTTHLSALQHQALATKLRMNGDARVQLIGLEVVRATQEGNDAGENVEGLRQRIKARLAPRLSELRQLQDELFPPEQRESLGVGKHSDWQLLLSKKHLGIMGQFGKHTKRSNAGPKSLAERRLQAVPAPAGTPATAWPQQGAPANYQALQPVQPYRPPPGQPAAPYQPGQPYRPAPAGYQPMPYYMTTAPPSIFMTAEAGLNSIETALDSARLMMTMAGPNALPPEAQDLLSSSSYFTQFADCELDAMQDATGGGAAGAAGGAASSGLAMSGAMKGFMCPTELGTQGNRAIANCLADLGIDGSPMFTPSVPVTKTGILSR